MDKTTRLGLTERMLEKQLKWDDISYILGVSTGAVQSEWHRFVAIRDLPPVVRIVKRKTDGRMGLAIKKISAENPKVVLRDYQQRLVEAGFDEKDIPSKSTIQRFLAFNGFVLRKLPKKTGISARNVQKRADWCKLMAEKPAEFWESVIWSDETTVRQAPKGKDVFVYVHQSTKTSDLPVNAQLHSGGFSVMFWGCFSKRGLGPLVALQGSMVLMQDNAPCHKAKRVMDFFANPDISVIEWPIARHEPNRELMGDCKGSASKEIRHTKVAR